MTGLVVLPLLGPAIVVKGQRRPPLVDHLLQLAQQLRRTGLRRKRHRPRREPAIEPAIPLVDERGGAADRVAGGVLGEIPGRLDIGHALPHDDADAGVLVGLQARVRELRAAGIDEAHRPALEQLDDAEQRRVIFLFLRHRRLQVEDVVQRARHLVGEDAADGMGVADVHVAVHEPRGDEETAGVDHAVGACPRQVARLADAPDPAVFDQDRSVADDPALLIEREDVARIVDPEALSCHGGLPRVVDGALGASPGPRGEVKRPTPAQPPAMDRARASCYGAMSIGPNRKDQDR